MGLFVARARDECVFSPIGLIGLIDRARERRSRVVATPWRGPTADAMCCVSDKCASGSKDTRAVCPYRRMRAFAGAYVRERGVVCAFSLIGLIGLIGRARERRSRVFAGNGHAMARPYC
jgi:hypothetical protein